MDKVLELLGRPGPLFAADLARFEREAADLVAGARFLVIGGAGSIGRAVTRELFKRNPALLHVVDIAENNLVELVRDLRSGLGYISGEFATFAIDSGSDLFDAFMENGPGYDYVLNLSALKHVRSEKDPYTLMRMIEVNVLNTDGAMRRARSRGARKYFCVSTDKAADPVNMMGASKRIMELFLARRSEELPFSTARFANVAFSDGSLLHGFGRRLEKDQPISAPRDVRRHFITESEAGELCLLSCLLGENRDVFFPRLEGEAVPLTFSELATRYLRGRGYEPHECGTEDEARSRVGELRARGRWPVYFFESDTTGEKDLEEFHTGRETVDLTRFEAIGVVKLGRDFDEARLAKFERSIRDMRERGTWTRGELIDLFNETLPEFRHKETGRFLDGRM
ncbi:MAG: UDP-N-acetylglucosamine 4,6-dehydratase [Spirochaetales bacterium]|nr:UDP-N-acetylglucosamine 4,6-dehydratase [Spirochaetales bacterium]